MSEKVVLCDSDTEWLYVHVTAELDCAKLTVSGVDCGKAAEEFWGDSDYEYWYHFDEENTALLFLKIGADQTDPLKNLKENFNGLSGCRKLRDFCDSEGIAYSFSNWI